MCPSHHLPRLLRSLSLIAMLGLLLSACQGSRAPELSQAEQDALDHIARTPFLRVTNVQRVDEHLLLVRTRQGGERVPYRIDSSDPEARPSDMVRRIRTTGLQYGYDRTKPRGTFPTRR